jgi:hypothetical protein
MPSAEEIRDALTALRNAPSGQKAAAKAVVTTLGGQTALTINDTTARTQFVTSLDAEIDDALNA